MITVKMGTQFVKNRQQQEVGFTIVELLVTIVVLGIAAASITSMFISIQNIQRRATISDSATRAAQREIEVLRNSNYSSLTPGQTIDFSSQLPSIIPASGRTATVAVSQPDTNLRRVDVTVTYKSAGKVRTAELSALIGEIGITQ